VGEVVGLLVVIGLAVAVIRRALTRGFGRPSSAGPIAGAPSARRRRPRDLAIAMIAAVLALAFMASSIDGGLFDNGSAGVWSTNEGLNMRAGFIAGCSNRLLSRVATCECVFARISTIPPYNTPSGFAGLITIVRRFTETRDLSVLPPAIVSGIRSCAGLSPS
jgi:hypothetical protein